MKTQEDTVLMMYKEMLDKAKSESEKEMITELYEEHKKFIQDDELVQYFLKEIKTK